MASRTVITLIDDLDGSEAIETVNFALDGLAYEIDLNDHNASALREALGAWTKNARRVGRPATHRRVIAAVGDSRSALIRAWAAGEGISVPARGRIPSEVRRQYDAAH